jgi:hypothetical protein
VRVTVLYGIGAAALGYGFWEFWRGDTLDQNAFIIGGVCLTAAAALQVLGDIWRRLRK